MIKQFLIQRGLYHNIKYSLPFRVYQRLFKPEVARMAGKELSFYRSFLNPCNLIFDVGAYDGHKTAAFLTLGRKVVCCEPDTANLQILRSRFRFNRGRVIIEPVAVAEAEGEATFLIHHEGSAFNTLNPRWKATLEADNLEKWNEKIVFSGAQRTVPVTTLDQLINKHGLPAFIKIDVEGNETKVLQGLTKKVPCISFESLLPHFKSELTWCIDRLRAVDEQALFNIAVDEQLILPQFEPYEKLMRWMDTTSVHHFEVIVKMNAE